MLLLAILHCKRKKLDKFLLSEWILLVDKELKYVHDYLTFLHWVANAFVMSIPIAMVGVVDVAHTQ